MPGNEYSLTYNSFEIPDRFVVTDGIICGRPIVDTGFTGLTSSGCAASSPCCRAGEFPGCTGNSGQVCPSDPEAVPQPGGGAGVGTTAPFVATTNKLYVIGFGVCASTGKPTKNIYGQIALTPGKIHKKLTPITLSLYACLFTPSPSNKTGFELTLNDYIP